jgi:tetratricopeptide (TPR) repeat protein
MPILRRKVTRAALTARQAAVRSVTVAGGKPPIQPAGSRPVIDTGATAEVVYWNSIKASNDKTLFDSYLTMYPDGAFADLAYRKIAQIDVEIQQRNKDRKRESQDLFQQAYNTQMKGDLNGAIALYTRSIDAYPTAEGYTFRGWTYHFQKMFTPAIIDDKKAIALDPDFGNPYNDIGVYLVDLGRFDEAIPWLQKAMQSKRYSERQFPWFNMAQIYFARQDYAKARELLLKSLEIKPDYDAAKKLLARIPNVAAGDKPKLFALAIGISQYLQPELNLKYAEADATAIGSALESQADAQYILFSDVVVHVLTNRNATRSGVLKELEWLSSQGTSQDIRLLFLSGRGDVDDRNNYFFYTYQHDPADFDLEDIPWDVLTRKLTEGGGRSVLLVDTHVGALRNPKTGALRDRKGAAPMSPVIQQTQREETAQGLVAFAASTADESSMEMDQYRHGAFTQAVLEGLIGGKADSNGDGIVETDELAGWTTARVRELTAGRQHPVYSSTSSQGSFPIFRVKR